MAGRAKENLPGGSLKYLFVYLKIRIFKCSYRIIISHAMDNFRHIIYIYLFFFLFIHMHIIYAEKQMTLLLEHPFGWGFPSHVWWHPGHVATMSRWLRCMHRVTRLFSWPFKKHRSGIGSLDRRALMWTSSSSGQNMYVYIYIYIN